MSRQTIRVMTSLVVIALCLWPVWKGYDLIRFGMAQSASSPAEAVRPWLDDPGVAFDAREIALTPDDASGDEQTARKRRDEIMAILAIRPLSSSYWLKLAEARLDNGEPLSKALEDVEMSAITGPNEEYMITQRGLFGIWQWKLLPPDIQRSTIADLVTASLSDPKAVWLKKNLAEKSEPVRQQIQSALREQGFKKGSFARIGLSAE